MDPEVVLRRIVDQALLLIPNAEGSVIELADGGWLTYVCAAGTLAGHVGVRLPDFGSLSGLAVAEGEIMLCEDSESDPRVSRDACRLVGAVSMVCVPLIRYQERVGVLKVTSSQVSAFAERDVDVLMQLSEFITAAVAAAAETSRAVAKVLDQPDPPARLATFVANVMQPGLAADADAGRRIRHTLDHLDFEMAYQPILDLSTGRVFAAEALCRFHGLPYRAPDHWFADAVRLGVGVELEMAAVRAGLDALPHLPPGVRLALNVGPQTIGSAELAAAVDKAAPSRIILELTEHLRVEDYPRLNQTLRSLRDRGTMLAIDDTGAGISSLTHILKLAPDIIKLDREITSGIDLDPVRRALASALLRFASESEAMVVAEGIETAAELEVLYELGVNYGQGFHLGRPAPPGALTEPQPATV